jgi:hypothetical protein
VANAAIKTTEMLGANPEALQEIIISILDLVALSFHMNSLVHKIGCTYYQPPTNSPADVLFFLGFLLNLVGGCQPWRYYNTAAQVALHNLTILTPF